MQLLTNFRVLPAWFGYYPHNSGTTRIIGYYPLDSGTTRIMRVIPAGTNVGLRVVRVRVKTAGTRKKNPLPITSWGILYVEHSSITHWMYDHCKCIHSRISKVKYHVAWRLSNGHQLDRQSGSFTQQFRVSKTQLQYSAPHKLYPSVHMHNAFCACVQW